MVILYIKHFNEEVADLILSVSDELSNNINAQTSPPLANNKIEIEFNINNLNRRYLDIDRTLLYEIIHATRFRWLLIAAETGNLNIEKMTIKRQVNFVENLKDNFSEIYHYYKSNHPDWQHEQMADHFIPIIKEALKELDPTENDKIYEALGWRGLKKTSSWKNLNQTKQKEYDVIYKEFYQKNGKCK